MSEQRITINVGAFERGADGIFALASQHAVEIDAEVFGHWAAHKSHDERGWSVTHVPSRLRAHSGVTKRDAIAVARVLSENMNAADVRELEASGPAAADLMSTVCRCDFCAARKHWNERSGEVKNG